MTHTESRAWAVSLEWGERSNGYVEKEGRTNGEVLGVVFINKVRVQLFDYFDTVLICSYAHSFSALNSTSQYHEVFDV